MSSDDLHVHIMDSDMAEPWNPDDMFESSAMADPALDFTQFLNNDVFSSPAPGAAALANGYHSPAKPLTSHREQTPALPQTHPTLQSRSTMSSSSPESSSQDSASETSGRRKRKLTSDSSPNHNTFFDFDGSSANNWQRDESQAAPANSPRFDYSKWVKRESDDSMGMDAEVDSVSRSMATAGFDYAASPIAVSNEKNAPTRTIAPTDMNLANSASARHGNGRTAPTREAQFLLGSRDPSPMSGVSGSQGPSPAAMMEQDMFSANYTPIADSAVPAMPTTAWQDEMSPGNNPNARPPVAQPMFPQPILPQRHPNKLWIHQDGNKSRVETQINIRMTLFPCPENVTRLHLPTNSISKPKLMAKQRTKDANTLELHTHLVCASAMEKRENLLRALDRAASYESNDLVTGKLNGTNTYSAEDNPGDPEKPLNGGPIRICSNCVQRERKRAARKRVKKQEDEEQWAQYEYDRVIVFNDKEYKEWTPPAPTKNDGLNSQCFPAGAKQVEVPMRIACYCRHQQEKNGFQVIFTIKDHQNRVLAQSITCPILITDDHKTNSAPTASGMAYDNSQYNGNPSVIPSSVRDSDMQTTLARRPYHSTNDLPGLQNNWTSPSFNQSGGASHGSSSTLTPRHASRQTSPVTSQHGPNKKRKSSSSTHSHKLPRELTMTRVNNQASPSVSGDLSASTTKSPVTASQNVPFMSPNDMLYGMPPFPSQTAFHSNPPTPGSTGPITPNRAGSIDNSQYQFYSSVPTSVNHSRAPSPSLGRQQMGGGFTGPINSLMNNAISMPQSRTDGNPELPPSIYKLMPAEYSKAGGIEVSCLGSNFTRNMEVLFGDQLATTTTYWNTQLLVCLLPPAACAGTVPVTIRLNGQPAFNPALLPSPPATFTYIDDDESRIYELAVRILCQKETGSVKNDDLRHFARGIVNRFSPGWSGASGGGHMQQRGNMPPMDTEEALLRVLNRIDMDDSPHVPQFNLKNKSGATMLSLASSLGYSRVVAGLLARGANPDARDVGGYTPLMMAAMHGHGQIVRRLILRGADPTLRTLQGYLAKDFATTRDVRDALVKVQSHRRTRSAGSASLSMRSRASSIGSTHSLWETTSPSHASDFSAVEGDQEDEGEESEESEEAAPAWTTSRRGSAKSIVFSKPPAQEDQPGSIATPQHTWRQNLSAQFQNLQNMHWNMPQLQLPALPQFPNIPGYQDHPVMQRISSLVPHRSPPRSPSATSDETARPSTESKWRDLFSVSAPPPPAYDEIYPENKTRDLDIKKRSVAQAAADHLLDQACEAGFQSARESEESSTASSVPKVEFGKKTLTKKQQKRVRRAHAHKMKQMRSDRNLFFIWIPLLLIVLAIMLHSHLDQLLAATSVVVSALQGRPQVACESLGTTSPVNQRVVEVP